MRRNIAGLWKDPFMRHNAVFFIGSVAVAALNYVYHPILSRVLSIASFGDLETQISFLAQAGILLGIFGKIAVNNLASNKDEEESRRAIQSLYAIGLIVIGGGAAILALASPFLASAFRFQSPYSLIVLALLIFSSLPWTFATSVMQGTHRFGELSITNALFAAGKIVFAVALVHAGFGVAGAMIALVLAQLTAISYSYRKISSRFSLTAPAIPHPSIFRRELPYAFLILCATGFITFLSGGDIIIVKYLFPPEIAGLYSGISIISNTILFVTASVAGVLLPSVSRTRSPAHNKIVLVKSLILNCMIAGSVFTVFSIFPGLIVRILIGSKYLPYAFLLPKLSLLMLIVSLLNLFILFFVALRKYHLIAVTLAGFGGTATGVALSHGSIASIVNSFIVGSGFCLLLLLFLFIYYVLHDGIQRSTVTHTSKTTTKT